MDVDELNPTQSEIIKAQINHLIDVAGYTDKRAIFARVVEITGLPRPTIRRVARELRIEWTNKIAILQSVEDTTFHESKMIQRDLLL